MRKLDTYEYVSALKELVDSGREAGITVCGSSMEPFLKDGRDTAFFKAPDRELRVGDIVFFQRSNGDYILHRICRIENGSYYMLGDGQRTVEGPIAREQIFALVTSVRRNGKLITPDNPTWVFFSKLWVQTSLRPALLRLYRLFS